MRVKGTYWKLAVIFVSILILHFEIDAYSNTILSIGLLWLYPLGDRIFIAGVLMLAVPSIFLIFSKTRLWTIILLMITLLVLIIFYPFFNMNGVRNAL